MGCASSKGFEIELASEKTSTGFSKGIGVASLPLPTDLLHTVALTSSTYGILKVDAQKPSEEECKGGAMQAAGTKSVKEVLSKLSNLEHKEDVGPQSWLEVSSMLENLKPELEKPIKPKNGREVKEVDSIDIFDMMLDLDEETGLVRPKARKLADLKKAGKSLPIRTLEELDKGSRGKSNDPNNGSSSAVMTIAEARALLKPLGTAKSNANSDGNTASVSVPSSEQQKPAGPLPDAFLIRRESELFDDGFLQSYKHAVSALSEDEWKVVEALCNTEEEEEGAHTGLNVVDKDIDILYMNMEMEQKEEQAAKISVESDDIFSLVEDEVYSSSSSTGSSTAGSSSRDLPAFLPDSPTPAPLEEGMLLKNPLEDYEELCPPGGKDGVVLYTTSLRSIRRTYEDCVKVREIVKSYGVLIDERDVSMHLEYRNELRELMQRLVTVPRLFVKGRYVGGTEVIAKLAEDGQLACLLTDTIRCDGGAACSGCAGVKFVPCLDCNGSCKIMNEKRQVVRCSECNENGLIHCPICC